MSIERLDYLKNLDCFHYLDHVAYELVYYFQIGEKRNTFDEGGILFVPMKPGEVVIAVYKESSVSLNYVFDSFPDWFKDIASEAMKIHKQKTRLRNLFKAGENDEGV